ncbi:CPBP family intramembrane metalloprotease [candidate division KSB1 bacterium]|nr:CPBP family intramembrane metalloprotease [candidate division KSB1 bacterium]
MSTNKIKVTPFGFKFSLAIFGGAGLFLYLETHFLIPYLSAITGWEPIIFWFLVAGLGIFFPMIIAAIIITQAEGTIRKAHFWKERLRFRKMTTSDWRWGIWGILGIVAASGAVTGLLELFAGEVRHQPPFMAFEPLTPDRYWLLLIWLPYWLLNIMGEEILWRGTILPGQELIFGKRAWIYHGFFWGIFHIAFGWQLLATLFPMLFIQSYIVQKRQNTWLGVLIHAAINGPSFLAISFGVI